MFHFFQFFLCFSVFYLSFSVFWLIFPKRSIYTLVSCVQHLCRTSKLRYALECCSLAIHSLLWNWINDNKNQLNHIESSKLRYYMLVNIYLYPYNSSYIKGYTRMHLQKTLHLFLTPLFHVFFPFLKKFPVTIIHHSYHYNYPIFWFQVKRVKK